MGTRQSGNTVPTPHGGDNAMVDVISWLLDADPAIRWQVMRDLADAPPAVVDAERSRVATEGWGAHLLSLQGSDGQWGGGAYSPKWTSTTYTLLLLRHLGLDQESPQSRIAAGRVRDNVALTGQPFFSYRGETCITGMCLALAAYFHVDRERAAEVAAWLLDEQLQDGGWNCQTVRGSTRSSFNTTISVLEGLLEHERLGNVGDSATTEAIARGNEYLLERRLFRSLSTGTVVNSRWKLLSFPPRWYYDVLRGLDHLREAGVTPDGRCAEAIEVVSSKRRRDGRWPLQNHHPGREHFEMEAGAGKPSRWNTLRAMRVLRWGSGVQRTEKPAASS